MIAPMPASVSLSVQNVAHLARDDEGLDFRTDEDTTFITSNVLTNDTDPDKSDTLYITSIDNSDTKGSISANGDGTFDYDPNGQFETLGVGEQATDTFTYTVSDGHGGVSTATVTITIFGEDQIEDTHFVYLPLLAR